MNSAAPAYQWNAMNNDGVAYDRGGIWLWEVSSRGLDFSLIFIREIGVNACSTDEGKDF
jgi:hypothetical protein